MCESPSLLLLALWRSSGAGGRASVVWEWVGWRVQNGEEDVVFRNNGAI